MKIEDLFIELADKDFQEPSTGNLFFPAYIYQYDPKKEYEIRQSIADLHGRLIRPDIYVDCLILNIFDEFITYLREQELLGESLLELILAQEKEDPEEALGLLSEHAHSDVFLEYLHNTATKHFNFPAKYKKVYLLLHGFGSIYPYLRSSEFLKNFEKHLSGAGYKLIVFYPGEYKNKYYHLFNMINDDNIYRATLLNPKV
ncbi:MAG: DUF1788 domain-containing protein [Calditrichaeota bacterium]|nr:MAG: DUF1788 domain-containing protein [Calditrichota bacterium]MBL1207137.1 DUF1788 domain-containing protein [Calditrichota bacterium]NOG46967.1 DUF1788 domain-containing protein [Calditrichota bacterium]